VWYDIGEQPYKVLTRKILMYEPIKWIYLQKRVQQKLQEGTGAVETVPPPHYRNAFAEHHHEASAIDMGPSVSPKVPVQLYIPRFLIT
jgi:hypothetical protein